MPLGALQARSARAGRAALRPVCWLAAALAAWALASLAVADAHWPLWLAWPPQAASALLGAATACVSHALARHIALRPGAGATPMAALLRLYWAWAGRWLLIVALAVASLRWLDGLHAASYCLSLALCAALAALVTAAAAPDAARDAEPAIRRTAL